MGKGLYLSIQNDTASVIDVSYSDFNCVYQNGDEGSDFGPIQGSLEPGKGFGRQYIEAKASGGCFFETSTFHMNLKIDNVAIAVGFFEKSSTWSVNGESFSAGDSVVQVSMQPGNQYECIVSVKKEVSLNSANWMSGLDDRQRFFDVLLPGTHDSGTYAYSDSNINNLPNRFVQCQDCRSDFLTQLRNGVRYFDLRVRKVGSTLGDNLNLFHGDGYIADVISKSVYLNASLGDALQAVERFLKENPTETVIVAIRREDGPCEQATSDIGPDDIQGYIDKYNIKWIAGHVDFQAIKDLRKSSGLDDLNLNINFMLETENPRVTGRKLNYDHLVVGDVRGRTLLLLSDMPDYEHWSSNIAALDFDGRFTNGIYTQNDYAAPEYSKKKQGIIAGAKGTLPDRGPIQDNQYSINFLSAASTGANPASSPVSFALTINAGMKKHNYETDDETSSSTRSPSLKTLLRSGGELYVWNLQRRQQGLPGLRGVMTGDFMLCPQAWYEDFWGNNLESRRTIVANPNSTDYAADDHLTRLIWSQNQLSNPK